MTRSGVTIFGVLLLVAISALIGTTVLGAAGAERGVAEVSLRRAQSRALAWSGVQAVMAELLDQRESILRGEVPTMTESWTLFENPDGSSAVVRLVDLDSDSDNLIVSESARLDVNRATVEMLAGLDLVDETLATAIVEARDTRRFESLGDLLEIEGMTPALLYGVGDDPRLADVLTVYGADPNVQAGLDDATHAGTQRINLNMTWSDRLGRAIAQRLDQDTAAGVQRIMESGTAFATDADVVRVLRFFDVEPSEWTTPFDIFTTSDDAFRFGRVDLSNATAEVLACVPGISPEDASTLVAVRDGLDSDERRSICWPVLEGVLDEEDFELAADWLTTRSMQWRVRIECGIEREGNMQLPEFEADEFGVVTVMDDADGLEDRIVVEAVIDIASQRARVAFLRDVTMLDLALDLSASALELDETLRGDDALTDVSVAGGDLGGFDDEPFEFGEGLYEFGSENLDFGESMYEFGSDAYDFGGDARDFGSGAYDFDADDGVFDDTSVDARDMATTDRIDAGASMTGTSSDDPLDLKDRRVGRWTGGGGD